MGLPAATATVAMGIIELGKLGLQMWFQAGRMAGKTKEEMDQMYNSESVKFDSHHPDTWADVPPDTDTDMDGSGTPGSDPK